LKDAAGVDVSFAIQSVISGRTISDPTGTTRVDSASSASEPRKVVIKQQQTGTGSKRVRRTLAQVTDERIDSLGVSSQLTLNLSWVFPLNGEFTNTDLHNSIAILGDLVGGTVTIDSTKVAALLQGQA
jgi:hypothetical protein